MDTLGLPKNETPVESPFHIRQKETVVKTNAADVGDTGSINVPVRGHQGALEHLELPATPVASSNPNVVKKASKASEKRVGDLNGSDELDLTGYSWKEIVKALKKRSAEIPDNVEDESDDSKDNDKEQGRKCKRTKKDQKPKDKKEPTAMMKEKADRINALKNPTKQRSNNVVDDFEDDSLPIFPKTLGNKTFADPRLFNLGELKHITQNYGLYVYEKDNRGRPTMNTNPCSMDQYKDYTLVFYPGRIPDSGVRLDDKLASLAARSGLFGKSVLHEKLPAEFDQKGDIRARRVPLGEAAKMYFNVGDKDVKDRALKDGEEGFYYLWHRGIHLLCGGEGFDPTTYLVRPSYYDLKKRTDAVCFLKELKAVDTSVKTPEALKKALELNGPEKSKPSTKSTATKKRRRSERELLLDDQQVETHEDSEHEDDDDQSSEAQIEE